MGILTDQVLLCQSGEHNGQMSGDSLPWIPGRGLWELQGQVLLWLPPYYLSGYNPGRQQPLGRWRVPVLETDPGV